LSAEFISEKTNGNLREVLSVGVNKQLLDDYDLIVAVNGTIPHESLGYSGGTKMFFPGVSNPGVIALLHWAAVIMGVPSIIGLADNPARDVVNEGTKHIFERIGSTPILSLNMVYAEDKEHNVVPKGLYAAYGFEGFKEAHHHAANLSSELHIVKVARPLRRVVQRLPEMYDEVWTAGKGSYKLQRKGVLAEGAEIILYGPHITCFHSNERMDRDIRRIGYHGLNYVLEFCRQNPEFDKNVAAHVINVRGLGELIDGVERFPFDVTLATGISEAESRAVGLGYLDPKSLREEDFQEEGQLWISDGGQWLYAA
jgi:nickel-dependent lactate racemase